MKKLWIGKKNKFRLEKGISGWLVVYASGHRTPATRTEVRLWKSIIVRERRIDYL